MINVNTYRTDQECPVRYLPEHKIKSCLISNSYHMCGIRGIPHKYSAGYNIYYQTNTGQSAWSNLSWYKSRKEIPEPYIIFKSFKIKTIWYRPTTKNHLLLEEQILQDWTDETVVHIRLIFQELHLLFIQKYSSDLALVFQNIVTNIQVSLMIHRWLVIGCLTNHFHK